MTSRPWYRMAGVAGFAAGLGVALVTAPSLGVSRLSVVAMAGGAVAALFAVAWTTLLVRKEESLTFYHHAATMLLLIATGSLVAGGPVLARLDVAVVGLFTFLVFGRTGCLAVGCCYGRVARKGVRYGPHLVSEGFPRHLVGVPLVPVQAVEAAIVAVALSVALVWLSTGTPGPGDVAGFLLLGYAVARIGLEFVRGDAVRARWRGLSQAQWTSLGVILVVAPLRPAWAAAAGAAGAAALWTGLRRSPLRSAWHTDEVVLAASRTGASAGVEVQRTSLGVAISAGTTEGAAHYSMSRPGGDLDAGDVAALARVLVVARHGGRRFEMVRGPTGVFHVVVAGA